ncbi:MAG: PIN domain-containing protein [Gammaproteobacteria bacterium]
MRVFLDSNVWVSAFATRGLCAEVVRTLLRRHGLGTIEVLAGEPVIAETLNILVDKFNATEDDLAPERTAFGIAHRVPWASDDPPAGIPDPDDVPIIACALAAGAQVFIIGDKALLELYSITDMPIISPRACLEWLCSGI